MACLAENTLVEFVEGRLSSAAAELLQEHIDACPRCLALLLALTDSLADEPAGVTLKTPTQRFEVPSSPPSWPAPSDDAPPHPTHIEEYHLLRPVGRGAMGQVFIARDTLLDRPVAIKLLTMVEPDEASRERFLVEARAVARLSHPNVVTVHRVGEVNGRPYLVSELIRGQGLERREMPMPWQEALRIGIGIARGLGAAHRRGVLHRDIKAANVMITDGGEVKLVDFGLAKLLDTALHLPPVASPPAPLRILDIADEAPLAGAALRGLDEASALLQSPSLTRTGAVLGTPAYMAPEAWRGEPATRQADIYSVGVLLYQLCAGRLPFAAATLTELARAVEGGDAPPLAELVPGVDPEFAGLVSRCMRRDPAERLASGDQLCDALERLTEATPEVALPEGNPYRGLESFQAEHRGLFFGRAGEVRAVLDRLRSAPFVLVAGDSGVGKSSLCRAGVLPAILDGALAGAALAEPWSIVRMVPGRHPLAALAAALAPLLGGDERSIASTVRSDPAALLRTLRRQPQNTILFVDQLEELVTLSDPGELAAAAQALAAFAVPVPGLRLLATVRSDFLARLAALPGLDEEVAAALYLLRPLGPAALREAIVGPARAKGYRFESEAALDGWVKWAAGAAGGLPLLQFALAELWEARDLHRQVIVPSALDAVGGVAGALGRHADGVVEQLSSAERSAARMIFGQLVSPDGTRARRGAGELGAREDRSGATRGALEALVRGRLLVAHADASSGGGSYELAHEALVDGWDTLRGWLSHDAERRAMRHRLERAAAEWDRLERSSEALWRRPQLAESAGLDALEPTSREAAFVAASRRAVRRRRLGLGLLVTALPLLVGGGYLGVRLHVRRDLDRKVAGQIAEARSTLALAQGKAADLEKARREAFARFDARDSVAGERAWEHALALSADTEPLYAHAAQSLETALLLDPARDPARALLGEVLFERASFAEAAHRPAEHDELVSRLALYDRDGTLRRRLQSPGVVTLAGAPSNAEVLLERYQVEGKKLRRERVEMAALPSEIELPPGSYRFTIQAPGRALVRHPFLLARGERLRLSVTLPATSAVPEGFVYLPPGRFRFGSADEGLRRAFLSTVPIHERQTDAFLIARHETTFAEWIDYLKMLPRDERSRRTPRVAGLEAAESVALDELAGGDWRLSVRPTSRTYVAAWGEPLRYAARDRHAVVDWRNVPVLAVSCDDAEAYVAWLDRSGRVPGARLCDETQWERAARGADGREYPHGDQLEPDDANYDETYGKEPLAFGPDEVGSHPASRSPFDVDDLAGNAWEWVHSSLSRRRCALRGGAYYFGTKTNRSTNREEPEPTYRDFTAGVRVCASLPPP